MINCKHKDCYYACHASTTSLQSCDYYVITGKHREQEPPNCPHYKSGKRKKDLILPAGGANFTYET